ncbi:phosphoethanolamine transferase [Veillonella criceti]|uniref:Phosphoethanolamine transferase CptA n=1 Tax=Veillonella criceti TaxID=103891 RepID=A0A380NH39_9FIRM|nr:phosphoethanolamine transferase [Veillonella criceti]SUP39505.1 Phosphoethanolamine transferase CptA [Veillonella criceti]
MSNQWLQTDIILAIYQTNFSEAKAYLASQSLTAWIGCLILLFLGLLVSIYLVKQLFRLEAFSLSGKSRFWCVGTIVILFLSLGLSNKSIKVSAPYILLQSVKQSVGDYEKFGILRQARENKLKSLTGLTVQEQSKGVYILIIGESESRDHMSLYGYNRETTPWLNEFSKNKDTIVFDNAYSNHTHTVPSLTYALSEKNQYNDISLEDANSIMEISKVAGIKTYWLSNQAKYGAWDTPIAEIASTATTQVWLNGNGGEETTTVYYDDKLIEEVGKLKNIESGLIVIHVMGSHGSYNDRFPASFNKFSGNSEDIDSYDNSILFNDYVLSQIYKEISQNPNYKAMIMMSDHGEDVEGKNSHDSSKFTYPMARIPLIVNFSESYVKEHQHLIDVLKSHKESYWTNDLMYDLLLSILGIQGAPVVNPKFDLSSPQYDRTLDTIRTLHGKMKLTK